MTQERQRISWTKAICFVHIWEFEKCNNTKNTKRLKMGYPKEHNKRQAVKTFAT